MFFRTTGDVRIDITESCWAVRIEVPREFLQGRYENDTSFIESDISNDYFYYKLVDQFDYYPYDANAPYTVEIWNPPRYLNPGCTGMFYNFTAPKYVILKGLSAPDVSGIYNFTVRIAKQRGIDGKPIFPLDPSKILQVPVSMREDPASIAGYVTDTINHHRLLTKGVIYAIGTGTGAIGRAFVNPETGFFNITGLYAGEYVLQGSAGFFAETGYAYARTDFPIPITVAKDERITLLSEFALNRGCIINGTVTYVDAINSYISIPPLESPYLKKLNYKGLNFTVEAYDESNVIVASRTYKSMNLPSEDYSLQFRNGTRYVGRMALGTEYAGFGPGTYTIKIWVYGFVLPQDQVKTVTITSYGTKNLVGESRLPYGATVSVTVRLFHGSVLETPKEGEVATYGTATGKHFGGNVLLEMYSGDEALKGLAVYNRTSSDGIVQYADFSSGDQTDLLRFYILGFSEHYNKSYSGKWIVGSRPGPSPWDYGIEDGTYHLRVWIRGYLQENVEVFTLGWASNRSLTIDMQRGGAFQVTVESWDTRVGTRKPQAPQPWRFLALCPPPRLRVYFTVNNTVEVGYAEAILRLDFPGVTQTTATLNFTGHNWSVDQIIFDGYKPTLVSGGNYTLKAYTYGYIQPRDFSYNVELGDIFRASMQLFIAGEIHGTVVLEMNGLFVSLTENATVRPEVMLNGELKGVDVVNATIGSSNFDFSTAGFYGRGHFFYVDRNALRWRDYGLDTGNYSVFVPEFGLDRMFLQNLSIFANVGDLNTMVGVIFHVERMVKIYGTISGEDSSTPPVIVPLVWASATAQRVSYSYDGDFVLHVPNGLSPYTVAFTCPGYNEYDETVSTNDQIGVTIILTQSGAPFTDSSG